jgi:hypothetical protein
MNERKKHESFDRDIELAAAQAKIAEAQGAFFVKISLTATFFLSILTIVWTTFLVSSTQHSLDIWPLLIGSLMVLTGASMLVMNWAYRDYKRAMKVALNDFETIYSGKQIDWQT